MNSFCSIHSVRAAFTTMQKRFWVESELVVTIISHILHYGPAIIQFIANCATIAIGSIAIWGLIFKRHEISLALRVFTTAYLNQKTSRIKETLGRLESLNHDNKDDRSEINALLGQLCGQLLTIKEECPDINNNRLELEEYVHGNKRINESKKRKIIYEIHGLLDSATFDHSKTTLRKSETWVKK